MSLPPAVTEATLHTPHGDLHPSTSHAPHYTPTTHNTHTMTTTMNEPTTQTPSMSLPNATHMTNAHPNTVPMPGPDPSPKPSISYGYATLPLPDLALLTYAYYPTISPHST